MGAASGVAPEFGAIVDAGLASCWRCGFPIVPGEPWDLEHVDGDRSQWSGPEHRLVTGRRRGARGGGRAGGSRALGDRGGSRWDEHGEGEDDSPLVGYEGCSGFWPGTLLSE